MASLAAQGQDDQVRQTAAGYQEIYRQEAAVRETLDGQYKALLSGVLRPEQMELLSGNLTPEQTNRLYRE